MKKATYSIHDYTFQGTDLAELRHIVNEVFDQHIYYVEIDHPEPRIIDVGAHIGVATHYFKRTHPTANLTAVEPHPVAFNLLQENCSWNRLENVSFIHAAVVTETQKATNQNHITLHTDAQGEWLSSTSILERGWNAGQDGMHEITVPAITLTELINNQPVQLLKMDIEGAEWDVLLSAGEELRLVERLVLEYHPYQEHDVNKLVAALQQYQLRLTEPIPASPKKRRQLQILEFVNKKLAKKLRV
jgi:FkbM family methyltransferase